jgi:lipoprotein-releasing system permease protein
LGEDFTVRDWKDMNAHLFASLKLERITMFLILAMIILVASFNIVTSLTMLVAEKRKDIAILKAMGATRRQIGRIFLLQGAIIGNLGTLVGFIFGLGICLMLKRSDWIELPDIFYDRSLPVKITPLYIGIIVVTSVFIVLIASWFPARNAASVGPVDGLKNT